MTLQVSVEIFIESQLDPGSCESEGKPDKESPPFAMQAESSEVSLGSGLRQVGRCRDSEGGELDRVEDEGGEVGHVEEIHEALDSELPSSVGEEPEQSRDEEEDSMDGPEGLPCDPV